MEIDIESLKYPIGQFQKPDYITKEQLREWTKTIQCFPNKLNEEIKDLTEADLQKQYRTNGWTIRQIINHCADSHMNSLMRFKLALTEETPSLLSSFCITIIHRLQTIFLMYNVAIYPSTKGFTCTKTVANVHLFSFLILIVMVTIPLFLKI